ncbi:hypothetical protein FB451DRAFT_1419391 [Mycena latifolia]|nr:hypothetical protein FB451DRAFT_1419391 [Mycena latifolia]
MSKFGQPSGHGFHHRSLASGCFLFSPATISPRRTHSYDFQRDPNLCTVIIVEKDAPLPSRPHQAPDAPESTHPGLTLPASGAKSDPDNPDFAQHIASESTATANFNKICSIHFQRDIL